MTNADYADDLALPLNTPDQAKSLVQSLEQTARGFCFHQNATEFMYFKQVVIITFSGKPQKLED